MAGRFPGARDLAGLLAEPRRRPRHHHPLRRGGGRGPHQRRRRARTTSPRAASSKTWPCSTPTTSACRRAKPSAWTRNTASSSRPACRRSKTAATAMPARQLGDRTLRRLLAQHLSARKPGHRARVPRRAHGAVPGGEFCHRARQRQGLPHHARGLQAQPARPRRQRAVGLRNVARRHLPGGAIADELPVRHGARGRRFGDVPAASRPRVFRRRHRFGRRPLPPLRRRRDRHRLRPRRRRRAAEARWKTPCAMATKSTPCCAASRSTTTAPPRPATWPRASTGRRASSPPRRPWRV